MRYEARLCASRVPIFAAFVNRNYVQSVFEKPECAGMTSLGPAKRDVPPAIGEARDCLRLTQASMDFCHDLSPMLDYRQTRE